ncbi:MAG TPA: lactonase family protein [Chitinophagaceae bacterium]|nr:lactonase family protein [Chitinophagaceae bacterium]
MKCFAFITSSMLMASLVSAQPAPANEYYLLIGTYTTGKSEGIYVYRFNSDSGSFRHVSTAKGIINPSYLAVAGNRYVYSVSEGDSGGQIAAFLFENGTLTRLNEQPSGGIGPCYVAVDAKQRWVAAGNYTSGSLAILQILPDGSLGAPLSTITHDGKSVNPQRQEKAHVHATVFSQDNRFLFVPDLGMDKVMVYNFNEKTGQLFPYMPPFVRTTPGSGPRHFDFHPSGKYAYLMEEMAGTVSVFKYDGKGKLSPIQNISSHPPGFKGFINSADIHVSPDGRFLYASNRGESNTIAIFSINSKTGKLKPEGHQSTLGIKPRNFNFDPTGNFLLVANQDSDNIVIFKIDKKTGLLTALPQQISVPNPVCIKWVKD